MGGQINMTHIRELMEPMQNEITLISQRQLQGTFHNSHGNEDEYHEDLQVQNEDEHQEAGEEVEQTGSRRIRIYTHNDGRFWKVPPGWTFPVGSCLEAWKKWCCTSYYQDLSIPPLRCLANYDVNHLPRGEMYLSELRFMMNVLQDEAIRRNIWSEDMCLQQATDVHKEVFPVVQVEGKRKTRYDTISWQMVMRKYKRKLSIERGAAWKN